MRNFTKKELEQIELVKGNFMAHFAEPGFLESDNELQQCDRKGIRLDYQIRQKKWKFPVSIVATVDPIGTPRHPKAHVEVFVRHSVNYLTMLNVSTEDWTFLEWNYLFSHIQELAASVAVHANNVSKIVDTYAKLDAEQAERKKSKK